MTNEKKTIAKIIIATAAVFLVLLIAALLVNIVKLSAANNRKQNLATQAAILDDLIAENNQTIDYYKSNSFIESYAREYLDMVYRGEIVISVK